MEEYYNTKEGATMKYCTHCGKELLDEAVICPSCGCEVSHKAVSNDDKKVLALIAKIFMVLSCVVAAFALIPLCWMIPMTVKAFRKLDNDEPLSIAFKVCTLIFVNLISGILLLCMDMDA